MYHLGHIFLIIISLSCYTHAQPDSLYEIVTENSDEDASLVEVLEDLLTHPIDINKTTNSELEVLPFLNSKQIDLILSHRPYSGKRDLRLKIGNDLYQLIRPYCIAKKLERKIKFDLLQRIQYPLEKNVGLQSGKYLGSPYEAFTKIRFEYNRTFKAGILFQKDAGEREFNDHVAGFIQWQDSESRLKLILGNYNIHVGQGLVVSLPYLIARGSSVDAVLKQRSANGSLYLSSNENAGFKGIFTGYKIQNSITFGGFYSQKSKDARSDEKNQQIIDFDYDGYHRTLAELKTKDVLKEKSYGGFIDISIYDKTHLGISGIQTHYKPFIGSLNSFQKDRQNFFQFRGNSIAAYSFFYTVSFPGMIVSGETATNKGMEMSNQHGLLINISKWNVGLKWWRIPVSYQTPYGYISTSPRAEQGQYLALEGHLNAAVGIYLYCFSEKKLWRTYFNPLPTQFREHYAQIIWALNYKTQLLCQYYESQKQLYSANMISAIKELKQRIRLQLQKILLKKLRLRTRIEQVIVKYSTFFSRVEGINLYQDLFWQLMPAISFSVRFSSFDTANYDSRIYEYEHDLPGIFSTYPLYGKGIKWYMLCSFKLWDKILLWIKYRNIHFYGIEAIGSGYSQIKGDTRQDIKFQIQIKH